MKAGEILQDYILFFKKLVLTMGSTLENRKAERFFKEGAYGTREFIRQLRERGLKSVWSHSGQPKKEVEP